MKVAMWSFKLYSFACSFPFEFHWEQGGTISKTKSNIKKFVSLLACLFELANMIFLLVTLFKNMKTYIKEQQVLYMTFHSAWCGVIWLCSANVYAITFLQPYLILIINETVKFSEKTQSLFPMPEVVSIFEKQKSLRERLISTLGFYCIFTVSLSPFLLIFFRYQDWYLVNYLTPEEWKPIAWKNFLPLLGAMLIEAWYMVTLWGNYVLMIYLHLIYLQTMETAMKILRFYSPIRTGRMITSQKQVQQKMKIYSELRIMNRVYNNAFKGSVWPMSLTLPCIIFIGSMCSLLRDKTANIVVVGFMLANISITFGFLVASSIFMSKINTESENLRHFLNRSGKETKVNRCLTASFKVIGIEIGSLYIIQRRSLFTLMAMLTNATVSALLSLNQL